MKITKSQLKDIIREELNAIDERKGGRRGISPMYRMVTGGGGAYSPSDDSVVDFLSDMIKDKLEDYRKKQKEKEARINPELTDKYMKKAGMLHPDEEVPGEEEERRLARFRSSNKAKLDRLMGRKVKIAGIDEIIRQELDSVLNELEESLSDDELRRYIEKDLGLAPGSIKSSEELKQAEKERKEKEASMPRDKTAPMPRRKKPYGGGSKYRPWGRST